MEKEYPLYNVQVSIDAGGAERTGSVSDRALQSEITRNERHREIQTKLNMNIKVTEANVPKCYNFHMVEREVMHELIQNTRQVQEESKELKEQNTASMDKRKDAIIELNTLLKVMNDLKSNYENDEREKLQLTRISAAEKSRSIMDHSFGRLLKEEKDKQHNLQTTIENYKHKINTIKQEYNDKIEQLEEEYGFKLNSIETLEELQEQHAHWKEAAMNIEKEFMFRKKRLYDMEQGIETKRKLLKQILDEGSGLKAAIIQMRINQAGTHVHPLLRQTIVKEVENRLHELNPIKTGPVPHTIGTPTPGTSRIPGIDQIVMHPKKMDFRRQYKKESDIDYERSKKDQERAESLNMKFRQKFQREKVASYREAKLEFYSHYYRFRSQRRDETDDEYAEARLKHYQHFFAMPFRRQADDETDDDYAQAKTHYEDSIQFRFRDQYKDEDDDEYMALKQRYDDLRHLKAFRSIRPNESAGSYAQDKFDYYMDMLQFRDQSLLEMDDEYETARGTYFEKLRALLASTDMELVLGRARVEHILSYKPTHNTKASCHKSKNTFKNAKANNIMELLRLVPSNVQEVVVKNVQEGGQRRQEHAELKTAGPSIPDKFKYFNAFKKSKQFDMKADHFNQMVERLKRIRKSQSTFSRYLNTKTKHTSSRKLKHYLQMLINVHRRKQKSTSRTDNTRASITDAFRALDVDNSGSVSPREFQQSLRVLGHNIALRDIRHMMSELDDDGDGSVDFKEFVDFYYKSMESEKDDKIHHQQFR